MRYARSKHNHNYRFTHEEADSISDEELERELRSKDAVRFDTRTQHIVRDKRVAEFSKLKTEEVVPFQGRSVSLKKIEPRSELMLTRRD